MKSPSSLKMLAACGLLALTLAVASCEPAANNTNAANANNSNAPSAAQPAGLPADATAVADAPGFYKAGPTGNVSLKFTAPAEGGSLTDTTAAPTFTITGYPIYQDAARKKGQHIHVILDNEPYEADYNPAAPFTPDKFKSLAPGTHTLRAFPSREWHESIKQEDAADFDFVTFNVGSATVTNIDKKAPLLTYSRPKGDYKLKDDPRGLMLDFYVTNAKLGEGDYKVRYTLDGKKTAVLTRWEPVWWKWEDVGVGEHTVVLELLDKNNQPVPFKVGSLDYNRTERKFRVTDDGAAADHHDSNTNGNTNAPANRNGSTANRNR
ncbi:MAG TPA: hypothetical protein VJZ91_00710 [Blastocatellia bacterium]|nr:hypothetical protein [Blastocatellia bacterium]